VENIQSQLAALGVKIPEILMPRKGIDLKKWAVIACDQFTQDRSYWDTVKKDVGDAPSTLNLIFPEVYLEEKDRQDRINKIQASMKGYLEDGVLAPPKKSCVYVERSTPLHPLRRGLVLAVDLDRYDWSPLARSLIRATEGTIKERLPPRMEIRRGASLESPHILLLVDDEKDAIIPALGNVAKKRAPLYDSPLMMNGGTLKGWTLEDEGELALLAKGLKTLAESAPARYGVNDPAPFLFAAGDGNHSLATAKAVWDEYRAAHAGETGIDNHPARWALVELENLYDPGISFEPIHRVIFGAKPETLLAFLSKAEDLDFSAVPGKPTLIAVKTKTPAIATASLQPLLDSFVKQSGAVIDYIHGEEELSRLAAESSRSAVGLLLPPVEKAGLFRTVAKSGPLPRKSFSMGEALEKRYYMECRSLFE
jgi:hypothetical protein